MQCPCKQFDIQKYKDKPYQQTPCATCFMTKETTNTNKHSILYDTDGAFQETITQQRQQELGLSQDHCSMQDFYGFSDQRTSQQLTQDAVKLIIEACQHNFLITLSNIVLKLTDLARTYPVTYQILHMKMQYPSMSYAEIGRNLNPPCSKQNVLYHLSSAVKQFPDLCSSIITDSRFSGGRYAIKNVASTVNRAKQVEKIRRLLYEETEANKRKTIQELKKEFDKPVTNIPTEFYDDYKQEVQK